MEISHAHLNLRLTYRIDEVYPRILHLKAGERDGQSLS